MDGCEGRDEAAGDARGMVDGPRFMEGCLAASEETHYYHVLCTM
jgi:hypothetical protein